MCWTTTARNASEGAAIRRAIADYLGARVDKRGPLLEAEIVIGELIANAIRHSPGPICADIEWRDDDRPLLSVHDSGDCFDERPLPEPLAESGRGLQIVRALADDVGVRRIEPHGCIVSAALRLTRQRDVANEPRPCPKGQRRSNLGCACALDVHGIPADPKLS